MKVPGSPVQVLPWSLNPKPQQYKTLRVVYIEKIVNSGLRMGKSRGWGETQCQMERQRRLQRGPLHCRWYLQGPQAAGQHCPPSPWLQAAAAVTRCSRCISSHRYLCCTVDSFFLGRSLNIIKCLLCTCQTLSYEVFRKLEDTKQNVISW